jgi:hypothetical protein
MKLAKYKCYIDSQFMWVAVKRSELKRLGLLGDLSFDTKEKGHTVYLFDWKDVERFRRLTNMVRDHIWLSSIEVIYQGRYSAIRSYKQLVPDFGDD